MHRHRAPSIYLVGKVCGILGIHIIALAVDGKECTVNTVLHKVKHVVDNVEIIESVSRDVVGLLSVVEYKAVLSTTASSEQLTSTVVKTTAKIRTQKR